MDWKNVFPNRSNSIWYSRWSRVLCLGLSSIPWDAISQYPLGLAHLMSVSGSVTVLRIMGSKRLSVASISVYKERKEIRIVDQHSNRYNISTRQRTVWHGTFRDTTNEFLFCRCKPQQACVTLTCMVTKLTIYCGAVVEEAVC